jgi:hypothetical protein
MGEKGKEGSMFDTILLESLERSRLEVDAMRPSYQVKAFEDGVVLSTWGRDDGRQVYVVCEYVTDESGKVDWQTIYYITDTSRTAHLSDKYRPHWKIWGAEYYSVLYTSKEGGKEDV